MKAQELLKAAKAIQPEIQANRRELHKHPELGLDMVFTKSFVWSKLEEMGYEPQDCGEGGIVAIVGGKNPGKCFLLRADMDALPIEEQANVDFRSEHPGKMHACGHDTHTAMLLGAAKLLKDMEDEIQGTVKLMFQPGEEIALGAKVMIDAGILENPKVDAAMMIHSLSGLPLPSGLMLVIEGGYGMASCDQYKITVKGKGGHGSMPEMAIDPITAAAHIHIGLAEIHSRELASTAFGVITTGVFRAEGAPNIIADEAVMEGTIRSGSEEVEKMLMARVTEIAENIGKAYRCEVKVEFVKHCPPMIVDDAVSADAFRYTKELLGDMAASISMIANGAKIGPGSEDFAFISSRVPSVAMNFATTQADDDGVCWGQHHPKVRFDDSKLFHGSATYAYVATRWLEEHRE